MATSLSERLHRAAPPSIVKLGVQETIADLDRILALPKRPPYDCERDPVTKKYRPETQALIEVMTEKFSRGPRVSCACRERRVLKQADGQTLIIVQAALEDEAPLPPIVTTVEAFVQDSSTNAIELVAARAVRELLPGLELTLPSADGMTRPCITMLNAVQSWFLREAQICGGVVGFCGVGSGKSFAFLLAPLLFPDVRLAVLLIEPKQRQHYRSQYLRLREHFRVTNISFDDGKPGYQVTGTPPLHLIAYSKLSRTENSDILDQKDYDLVMADEGHRACGQSAINRRIKRFGVGKIKRREEALVRGEPVRARAFNFLIASGTPEAESIGDTHMPCAFALGTGSPLPLDPTEMQRYAAVMDRSRMPDRSSKTFHELQHAFGDGTIDMTGFGSAMGGDPGSAIRKGFCQRRLWTPGIISSSAASINASIYLYERKPPKMPPAVHAALMKVRTEGLRPDDEVLVEKVQQIACARNVGCGFYNYWAFPKHACTCTAGERCDQCRLIDAWYLYRKAFNKDLRAKVLEGERQLDTQKLCEDAAVRAFGHQKVPAIGVFCEDCWLGDKKRGVPPRYVQWPCPELGHVPAWRVESWPAWSAIENKVEYEEREKWIEPGGQWLVEDVAGWASDHKGVIWFQSTAFGRALAKLTKLPYFNGGPGAEDRMRELKGDRSIICSIKAHGAGTDGLQLLFNEQFIVESPASNAKQLGYEQLLGRLHREGQRKPEVWTGGYFHVRELKDALRKAVEQAELNFERTGNRQKLLMADISVEGV